MKKKKFLPFVIAGMLCCAAVALGSAPEVYPVSSNAGGASLTFGTPSAGGDAAAPEADAAGALAPRAAVWAYPVSREVLDDADDLLRLANKQNLLDKNYPPKDTLHKLVKATVRKTSGSTMQVRQVTHDALALMFSAAKEDGITLYLHSAYRSYSTQSTMYKNRLKSLGRDDGMVQAAGASDHQTGMGVDVISKAWIGKKLNGDFIKTKEGQWMAENCARFGFVVRYPEDKYDVTGIHYEPWHLRYVGVEAARYMTQSGLTLEEFTEEWHAYAAAYDAGDTGSAETNYVFDVF